MQLCRRDSPSDSQYSVYVYGQTSEIHFASCMTQLPNHSFLVPPKTSWCIQMSCEHIRNDAGFTADQQNVIKRCIWVSQMELLHMFRHLNWTYVDSIIVPFALLAVVTRQRVRRQIIPPLESFSCSPQIEVFKLQSLQRSL